jgi:GR25 family glycosyltransferase involved in LPS biosynthesis
MESVVLSSIRMAPAMRIHLINLDRSAARLAEFMAANRHLANVSRFPAIEGDGQDIAALVKNGIFEAGVAEVYTPGALGAALSHLALWNLAIETGETLTISEDDAVFNHHFATAAARIIENLPADWDFVLWGWNFDSYLLFELVPGVSPCLACFDEQRMRAGIGEFQSRRIAPQVFRLQRALGIPAYSISPKGARVLKAACLPLPRIKVYFPGLNRHLDNFGIDIMMNNAYPQIEAHVSFPPLVLTRNEIAKSTVQINLEP